MIKKKIFIHIMGARPNFIKAFPLIQVLEKYNISNKILHTGQHYDYSMSDQFFKEFKLPKPFSNLDIGSLSHGAQTGRMLEGIEKVLINNKSDFVIIYGDTNSTVAGALAAVKLNIPLAHIEGGVRTKYYTSPEEINRKICDHISTVNFAPTISSKNNLLAEGIDPKKVFFSGDVMYDMAINFRPSECTNIDVPENFVLATIHRQENTDDFKVLKSIFKELINLSSVIPVIMPLHPRTKNKLIEGGFYNKVMKKLRIIEPLSYSNLLYLIKLSKLVISDSGGVPKEAAFLKVPSIFIGDNIVWHELVEQKWTLLLPPSKIKNLESYYTKIVSKKVPSSLSGFGDANASIKIADFLLKYKADKL
ncbi:UDP-N-acetylglucosamine 2-epimerase (non-hydrolyzing) [Alphaproteobacteria bacterium]|nr:UDP-N-acetylglucosamine 2-epimerase (non-hydrolyzing) [Alphaproteobacteria bacterium]